MQNVGRLLSEMYDSANKLKEIQQELFELMVIIDRFCRKNNIKYSLTGGSLLGAIRHQGFIPWDDDFDIMLTRKNFEKFKEKFYQQKRDCCVFERDQWVYRIRKKSKVKGYVPSIDFFIVDKVPKNPVICKIQLLLLKIMQGMLRTNEKENDYSLVYKIMIKVLEKVGKLFKKNKIYKWYDRVSQWERRDDSSKVAILNDRFRLIGYQYDASLMSSYVDHTFETVKFQIIARYEDYLKLQFGNYMELPPEEERVPQHIF